MIKKILIFTTLLVISNSSILAIDLDSLFINSIGGTKALTQLSNTISYTIEGKVNFNGTYGTFIEHFEKPNKLFLRIKLSEMTLIQAYDGQVAWQQDHNGRASELSGFEQQALLTSVYMESFSYLLPERTDGGAIFIGDTISDGNSYHKVAFYPQHNDTVIALFDKVTGMRSKIIDVMDNITAVVEYSDFREVSDILFPFHINNMYLGIPMFIVFDVDSIVINSEINNSIFQMPVSNIDDFKFNDSNDRITIPFEYKHDHIWLSASLNGRKKVWFILDSGSSANFFNTKTISGLELEVSGTMPVMGIAGFDEVQLVKTDSISIGSLTLLDQIAGTMDLSNFEKIISSDREFGGILGYDFLSRFPIMIDYQNNQLTLFNPEKFIPPTDGYGIPFKLTMLVPTVEAEIEGIKGDFIVDLGNSFGLVVHNRYAEKHNLVDLLIGVNNNKSVFGGIGGKLKSRTGTAGSFKIGEIILTDIEVLIPSHGEGLAGSSQLAGNIGNQLLNKFRVLFDYGNSKLIFYDNE